jgi:hypothetical protein
VLAHKITVTVPESRHVEIDLPSDFPVGEVIVLFEPKPADVPSEELPRGHWKRVQAFLAESYKVDRPRMTKEEIDAYLAEERASWGDEP